MNSRTAFPIALPAAVLLSAVVGAAPARAADGIGLSPDGVVWYDALHRPLFDPERRWVPGDAETAAFYVRNEGPTPARLTIELRDVHGADLTGAGALEITARAGGGPWITVGNDPSASLAGHAIGRDGPERVEVRVEFRWQAPNGTMLARLPLDFEVRLVQAGASGDDAGGSGSGSLPPTGSAITRSVILLGAVLVGSGLALLALARRRRVEPAAVEEEVQVHG